MIPPPIQLSIAEIVEEADHIAQEEKEKEADESTNLVQTEITGRIYPDFNVDNVIKSNAVFADKQKVSIISLIKLLIPVIESKQVIVTLTKQQEEFIGDVKIEWQAHLREYFNDRTITLLIRTDDNVETKRQAYTPSEQFREMMDENETFRKMVQKFKLKLKQ